MELVATLRIAVRALGRHKLRTFLTMLGLIIGVAAVMTMVALGSGAQASVEDEMKSAGTNLVYISAGNYTRGGDDVKVASGLGARVLGQMVEVRRPDFRPTADLVVDVELEGWKQLASRLSELHRTR